MSFLRRIEAANGAPSGSIVTFEGKRYKKGFTDQPTWIPVQKGGLIGVIPSEDEENYDAIEQEWQKQSKPIENKPEPKLAPDIAKKVDKLQLELLKAPSSKKQEILDKITKLKSK